ncbi:MAG: NUDIX domain-containing protein [Bacteroidales bacterium]|nr:NUDIX domain-containing protein [Bacteroidales bacterium]
MTAFYKENDRFFVAVDCIIFGFSQGELNLLLLKRNFEPAKGEWSLMGGFLEKDESINQAAQRVLYELTGLDHVYMRQVGVFGEIDRDPGERVVSAAYYALMNIDDYDPELARMHNAQWIKINELPVLIFDHQEMVNKARLLLQKQAATEPIGFNLLPKLFTLTQLQMLYEAISGEDLDKRNFRKKVAEMDFIEKTDEKDKSGSKRGAYLYKFNDKIYKKDPKFKL